MEVIFKMENDETREVRICYWDSTIRKYLFNGKRFEKLNGAIIEGFSHGYHVDATYTSSILNVVTYLTDFGSYEYWKGMDGTVYKVPKVNDR